MTRIRGLVDRTPFPPSKFNVRCSMLDARSRRMSELDARSRRMSELDARSRRMSEFNVSPASPQPHTASTARNASSIAPRSAAESTPVVCVKRPLSTARN